MKTAITQAWTEHEKKKLAKIINEKLHFFRIIKAK